MNDHERSVLRRRALFCRERAAFNRIDASGDKFSAIGAEFNRGLAAGYELEADFIDGFLGESTVTPLVEDVDEKVKESIRETVIEGLAMDALSNRPEEF